ncbi:hypothetical protein EU528_10545 [Candidatus Thorarchaeota archaeon]|nr:MAG: hypothetical protein EU528_10545 [Candidatus Thorarchaeota archaeon]
MWLTTKDRAILKAQRKTRSSQGKSALPQRTPDFNGESVADPYDQMTFESTVRSEDPAMVNAVEEPSAITQSGECESMQRTEARSHRRNDVPVKRGKDRDTLKNLSSSDDGDISREKGGTQKFLTVHSQL